MYRLESYTYVIQLTGQKFRAHLTKYREVEGKRSRGRARSAIPSSWLASSAAVTLQRAISDGRTQFFTDTVEAEVCRKPEAGSVNAWNGRERETKQRNVGAGRASSAVARLHRRKKLEPYLASDRERLTSFDASRCFSLFRIIVAISHL